MAKYYIWKVRAYYGAHALPPHHPGDLASETMHPSDATKDTKVTVLNNRADIGAVQVEWIGDPNQASGG